MKKLALLVCRLAMSGQVDPANTVGGGPADPKLALQQQQVRHQRLGLRQQALNRQKARDAAAKRAADEAADEARSQSEMSEMHAGRPGVPQVALLTVAYVERVRNDQPPTGSRIPGKQCSGTGDDASCDALGTMCSGGAIRDDCADAPPG